MIDLSIIIISYNTKDFLQKCLLSVYAHIPSKYSVEVIVVDNASADDSVSMVKKEFSNVLLLQNEKNLGFSKANNVGIKKAQGRYILFLNSDTEIEKNTLETMVDFMESHEDAGAATCKLMMPNGKIDDASHRGFPTPWNALCYFSGIAKLFPHTMFFNGYNYAWRDLEKIHTIDALAGAFMIVRRKAGEAVRWWDEDYFFYGEDLDFCFMLKEKGWKIYFVPSVATLHYKGVSGGIKEQSKEISPASLETKRKVTKERFKAMRLFYQKHYLSVYPGFITWLVMKGIAIKLSQTLKKYQ